MLRVRLLEEMGAEPRIAGSLSVEKLISIASVAGADTLQSDRVLESLFTGYHWTLRNQGCINNMLCYNILISTYVFACI